MRSPKVDIPVFKHIYSAELYSGQEVTLAADAYLILHTLLMARMNTQEDKKMESKRESILKQKEEAELKVQQYQHKIQLLENRKKHLEKKADRQRTHHLCNMGGAIQSISKEADALTRVEFYSMMEQVFALPAVQELVSQAMQRHETGGEG